MPQVDRQHVVLDASLHPSPAEIGKMRSGLEVNQVSIRVSLPKPGRIFTVSHESSALLVRTGGGGSEIAIVHQSDKSVLGVMRGDGEALSLECGTFALTPSSSTSQLVRFDVPRTSFHNFCKRNALGAIRHFRISNVAHDDTLHLLSRTICSLIPAESPTSATFNKYFILSLFSHLAETYGMQFPDAKVAMGGLSPKNRRLIEDRLRQSSTLDISSESLAADCHLSTRHFARAFMQSFGVPFHRFQRDLRLDQAKQLLQKTDQTLKDIAARMGYADQATFTESFKRDAGMPPGRYRRQYSSSVQA